MRRCQAALGTGRACIAGICITGREWSEAQTRVVAGALSDVVIENGDEKRGDRYVTVQEKRLFDKANGMMNTRWRLQQG